MMKYCGLHILRLPGCVLFLSGLQWQCFRSLGCRYREIFGRLLRIKFGRGRLWKDNLNLRYGISYFLAGLPIWPCISEWRIFRFCDMQRNGSMDFLPLQGFLSVITSRGLHRGFYMRFFYKKVRVPWNLLLVRSHFMLQVQRERSV